MIKVKNQLEKIKLTYRSGGMEGLRKLVKRFILKKIGLANGCQNDTFLYLFINNRPNNGLNKEDSRSLVNDKEIVLNWIIPDFLPGSGGHMTIFRLIHFLETKNIKNNIYMFGPLREDDAYTIKRRINKHFIPLKADVKIGCNYKIEGNAVVATSWPTVYPALKIDDRLKKLYFVQDFEPSFYPYSSEYIFAENTYKKGLFHICASSWLASKLKEEYKAKVNYFNLGYDSKYYFPNHKSDQREEKTIVFYGRWVTPRRGFELGILSLLEVYKKMPDVKIKIFGWSEKRNDIPFPYEHLGILTPKQLGDLYRRATVGLSISLTNISLMPIEMMACKLPVVEINHPSITADFENKGEILISDPDPKQMAENLILALTNKKLRDKVASRAYALIQKEYNWNKNFKKVENIIRYEIK